MRVTASKVQKILRARNPTTRLKYFRESSIEVPSLKYGRSAEERARKRFEEVTNRTVIECGLIVKPEQPWCAASPDGLLLDNNGKLEVLEIKCPYSCRDTNISVNYVKDGQLLRSHPYFCQVQFQMYVTNARKCHFFVYSDQDIVHLSVDFDDEYV